MTILCLVCSALAVWWVLPPLARPERVGPLANGRPAGDARGALRPWPVVGAVACAGLVTLLGWLLDGVRGGVLGLDLVVIGGTIAGLTRQRRRRRAALRAQIEVARACAALSGQLRIGQVPSEALAVAAEDCTVLRQGRDAQKLGGSVTQVWRQQAGQPGCGGLMDLARAWEGSSRSGAPMSAVLEHVAEGLAADQSVRSVVAGELSAPRATGKVMAALPGCGVGLGYLLGGDPIGWLLAGPPGWACLLGGVVLACLGVLWIEALAERAAVQAA